MKLHELRAFIMKEALDGATMLQEAIVSNNQTQIALWEKHVHDREIFIALLDAVDESQ